MTEVTEEAVNITAAKPVIEDRIYVGNLDYKATEEELRQLFSDLKVTDVEIPFKERTRDDQTFKLHLGFAFVQFENKEEADKAIANYNGQKLQRRIIFIKKAVPPPTEEEKLIKIEAYKAKREEYQNAKKLKKKDAKRGKEGFAEGNDENGISGGGAKSKSKLVNGNHAPEGEKSTDTIFVTNLDYKVNVKVLSKVFEELKPKWIHVPIRKFYKKRETFDAPRRPLNRGIAFVKFSDEETQKKAVAEFNGKEVRGRKMIIDYAVNSKVPDKDGENEGEEEGEGEGEGEVEIEEEGHEEGGEGEEKVEQNGKESTTN
ncbi:hypothetical protein KGF56_001635 [Candida oxycetoniae]|uniref:RRM domain-containing protein n=1 Tax=Candida oxycetoniae TaxID=497107 RepID=A0AAI9WYS5_9ASCO|nr:uncharacterized protein KGF56_001635 [Candida oxycetoniae]KAI3405617.2 hypothetical protein KGF56_001635 [Candida oxycetoniae]